VTNYQSGHEAEKSAAQYLEAVGHKIKDMNWKTRYCEIDIITEKNGCVFFVEVKSRKNSKQGFGSDYVTSKKLRQMRFAAEMWVHEQDWQREYQLAVISIDAGVISFIDSIDV